MHKRFSKSLLVGMAAVAVAVPAAAVGGSAVAGARTPKPPKVADNPVAGFTNATPAGDASDATTVTVPTATCPDASAGLAGGVTIWDSTEPPVSSVGQAPASAVLQVQCVKGSIVYYVSATVGLAQFRFPVEPGDSVNLSVGQTDGVVTAAATDTTSSTTESASAPVASPGGVPLDEVLGVTSGATELPTVTGGQIDFSGTSVDGSTLSDAAVPTDLVKKNATVLTASSPTGGAFTVTQP